MGYRLLEGVREGLSEEGTFHQRPLWSHCGAQALNLGHLPEKRLGKLADTAKLGADDLLEAW